MPKDTLIAIVEDHAPVRDAMQTLIQSFGFKAVTFDCAELFLGSEVLMETTCLITDLQMPGLSGLELQDELRSRGYRTPVIVITAYSDEKHRTRALNNGAVGFLVKPFDDEVLLFECLTAAISGVKPNTSM